MLMDWFRIICELERAGVTHREIARACGVSRAAVSYWKAASQIKELDLRGSYERALLKLHAEMLRKLTDGPATLCLRSLTT